MKHKLSALLALVLSCAVNFQTSTARAQGTAFSYQGRLNTASGPANGTYDLSFTLFSVSNGVGQVGSPLTNTATAVSNGLFTVALDFGSQFPGAARWLEIGVRSNGAAAFATLAPRQPLTPTPYAIYAESANATNLVGTVPAGNLSGVALLNGGNTFSGNQTFDGGNIGIGTSTPSTLLANTANNISGSDGYGLSFQSLGWYSSGFGYAAGFYNPSTFLGGDGVVIGIAGTSSRVLDLMSGGNNSVMVVNGNGNVGIGTNHPANTLDVRGSADFTGSVGIGTTTPSTALQVVGTVSANGFSGIGTGLSGVALLNGNNTFTGNEVINAGGAGVKVAGTAAPSTYFGSLISDGGAGDFWFLSAYSASGSKRNTIYGAGGSTPLVFQEQGGNVGIGTITPSTTLQVNGTVTATSFAGNGSGLSSLAASQLTGTVADASLSTNVALLNGNQTFTGTNVFNNSVGIGTVSPVTTLDVNGNGHFYWAFAQNFYAASITNLASTGWVALDQGLTNAPGYVSWYGPSNYEVAYMGYLNGGATNLGLNLVNHAAFNINGGNVGIGTSTPTAGLEVENSPTGVNHGSWGYLQLSGYNNNGGGGFAGSPNLAIYTSGAIGAATYYAFSDARIKNVIGVSSNTKDLATLRDIQITDYTYKDKVGHGDGAVKKVIAQQVESVYPQAVSKTTGVIPDIYQPATFKDGWVQLATNLKVGESVKLISEGGQGIYKVLEIHNGEFRTDFQSQTDKVFVFGRQVDDFRNVDYEALTTLNISATQELARRLESLEAREAHLAELEQQAGELASMKQEMAEIKQLVAQLARESKSAKLAESSTAPNHAAATVRQPLVTASLIQ